MEIKLKIKNYRSDKYMIKRFLNGYRLLRKHSCKLNWLGRILLILEYEDKYTILYFFVEDDSVIVNAYSPKELEVAENCIPKIFGDIPGVKIIIRRQYCPWKFEDYTSKHE